MKNLFVLLITAIISVLSLGNLYANSCLGHNTIAIYCIWKMSHDNSFMPSIQGNDRYDLTHPNILTCSEWNDLSDAQKAFLQGANFPDCPTFMIASHNEAPMEILSAMYTLKDYCPPYYKNKSENVKAFICRMQRFMTWGSKLHIEMDKITHAKLPYAKYNLKDHVWIEDSWDELLFKDILHNYMMISDQRIIDRLNKLAKDGVFGTGFNSRNYHYNNESLDLRDKYVDFILSFYKNKYQILKQAASSYRMSIAALRGKVNEFRNKALPDGYQYPGDLASQMINLANTIDVTREPTQSEINNQYDIDLPKSMQTGSFRIGTTPLGQSMLQKVNEYKSNPQSSPDKLQQIENKIKNRFHRIFN